VCTFPNTYSTNLVDIYGCFRPYHARPIMQPYSYHFRTECEAEDESSVQLFPQDSAQVAEELFDDSEAIIRISALHLDCGYNLQPPNRLWLERSRLVDSIRRKQKICTALSFVFFWPFIWHSPCPSSASSSSSWYDLSVSVTNPGRCSHLRLF